MRNKKILTADYMKIVSHYESCLDKYGDSHLGVDWPKLEDVNTRHKVMLEVIRETKDKVTLLDFGCGASHLYDYIQKNNLTGVEYSGLDISEKFINVSKTKYPQNKYYTVDILHEKSIIPEFDYIVMNGVFTEKRELSFDEMFGYFKAVIDEIFKKAKMGIAFNLMSKHVAWERDDLFHVPFDQLASHLQKNVSRKFVIRSDYGLYEFTTYVYR